MAAHPETIGVVLAGGQSRRMGGQDKAQLALNGTTLIAHAAQRLAPQCTRVILNANGDGLRFAALNLPVVADSFEDYRGPLAGILAALDWMADNAPGTQWLASIAVDTPFFPEDFVSRLHGARRNRNIPVLAQSGDRRHPVNTLWPVTLRDALRASLAADEPRKVGAFLHAHDAGTARWSDALLDPFLNVNTPEEFAAIQVANR